MSMSFEIRCACPADMHALETLYARSFGCLLRGDHAPFLVKRALPHLRHFAVDPATARAGVGRAIFNACRIAAGRETGLECYATRNALPFYSALGFRAVGEKTIPMEADLKFPSVHMIRDPEKRSIR